MTDNINIFVSEDDDSERLLPDAYSTESNKLADTPYIEKYLTKEELFVGPKETPRGLYAQGIMEEKDTYRLNIVDRFLQYLESEFEGKDFIVLLLILLIMWVGRSLFGTDKSYDLLYLLLGYFLRGVS